MPVKTAPPAVPIVLRTWNDVGMALVRILKKEEWSFACENLAFDTDWLGDSLLPIVVVAAQSRWRQAGLPDMPVRFTPDPDAQARVSLDPSVQPRPAALWLLLALDVLTVPDAGPIPSFAVAKPVPHRVDLTKMWTSHHQAIASGALFAHGQPMPSLDHDLNQPAPGAPRPTNPSAP